MPRSVLLVDDAVFVRSMLREILERSGAYRVVAEASDGVAALTLAPELQPDLVITDLIMPGLDGIELARALGGSDSPFKVILAASADQEGAVLNGLLAGASDFVTKPFAAEELLRILAGPPPVPAADDTAPPRSHHLSIGVHPLTPLPRARRRAIAAHLRRLDPAAEVRDIEESAPDAACTLEAVIVTRLEEEVVRGWVGRLRGVAESTVRMAPASASQIEEKSLLRGASPLNGSLKIKASLLDRLLDHLDQLALDRQELAQQLSRGAAAGESPALQGIVRRIDRGIVRMRSEILAARLVPFNRIASRLVRAVEESGRGASRRAALRITGGETRLDLAVLEEIADLLGWWLPRVVVAEVGRADILRQLGLHEEAELHLSVSRSGSRLVLILRLPKPTEQAAERELDPNFREKIARLGGSATWIENGDGGRVEIVLPAGVSLVRSYLCQAGRHLFAIPVASVEGAVELPAARIRISEGRSFWQEEGCDPVPLVRFPRVPWTQADGAPRGGYPGLLYRVGPQRYALAVDALLGEADVLMRPLNESGGEGQLAGVALTADGGIAMVPDLPNLARVR